MLGVIRGDGETGLYNAAYRVYEGLANVGQVLQTVLIPRLSRDYVANRAAHGRLARRGLLAGGLLAPATAAAGFLLGERAVILLFGPTYASAGQVLQLLSIGFVVVLPLCALHAVALSVGAGGWLLRTAVVGCVANVALNLVLIPRFGMHGAAAATVAGEALSMAVLAGGLRRHIWPLARVSRPTACE